MVKEKLQSNPRGWVRNLLGGKEEKVIIAGGNNTSMGWQERTGDVQSMARTQCDWSKCRGVGWLGWYCLLSSGSYDRVNMWLEGHVLSAQLAPRPSWACPLCPSDVVSSSQLHLTLPSVHGALLWIGLSWNVYILSSFVLNSVMSSFGRV